MKEICRQDIKLLFLGLIEVMREFFPIVGSVVYIPAHAGRGCIGW